MIIESKELRFINVYAPNKRAHREAFFDQLRGRIARSDARTHMLGDFNCALDATKDRVTVGRWGSHRSESAALDALLLDYDLIDALDVTDDRTPSLKHLTYWQGASGARLDRSYTSRKHTPWIVGVDLVTPHSATDHEEVVTWIRDPRITTITKPLAPNAYPVHGRDQAAIDQAIGKHLHQTVQAALRHNLDLDTVTALIKRGLKDIKRTERRRKEARERRSISTLQELIAHVQARIQRRAQARQQETLLQRSGHSAQLFRRLVQRETAKPIPELDRSHSTTVPDDHTNADVMAQEWNTLLGYRHATVSRDEMATKCRELFEIPEQYKLTPAAGTRLVRPIQPDETLHTIAQLGAHKAAGADRLNNDFFRDWGEALEPWLTREFNRILQGGKPAPSFAEAIIMPLPKQGDPKSAFNYRPISLLTSAYKIFTKIFAERVQASLSRVINADQNGFVRGRALSHNVHLLQALIEQAKARGDSPAVILFLDLCKAYDSMDREFLWQVLEEYGCPKQFISMLQNLHDNTTAAFLVNGEVSSATSVKTGIRQGCPLAPLLFLIAVEALKHAVDQTPGLEGITLTGAVKNYVHIFSAFVDDSVVCLKDKAMIQILEDTLQRFAAVSGLRVQPQKSHALLLTSQPTATMIGSFPVLPAGNTLEYLGVQVGWTDLQHANWDRWITKLRKRLGFLSQFATGLHDRIQILNLAATPSILFTAAFVGPTPEHCRQLDELWRQYIWTGTISVKPQRAHKIAAAVMAPPRTQGGLGLVDFKNAIAVQAVKTLLRWNTKSYDKYWEALNFLLAQQLRSKPMVKRVYPASHTRSVLPQPHHPLTHAYLLLNAALAHHYVVPPAVADDKREFQLDRQRPWLGLRWLTSRTCEITIPPALRSRWTQLSMNLYAAMPIEIRTFWPTFPWADNLWVTDQADTSLKSAAFPRYQPDTIDQIRLVQTTPGTFRFRDPRPPTSRHSPATTKKLAKWISVIIANHPSLPDDLTPAQARVYPTHAHDSFSRYEWTLTDEGKLTDQLLQSKWFLPQTRAQLVIDCPSWMEPIQWSDLPQVRLAGHPQLQHGPTLLPLLERLPIKRTAVKTIHDRLIKPLLDTNQDGLRLLRERRKRQSAKQPEIADPLQATSLRSLLRQHWGTSSQQTLFWYRITVGALNTRNQQGASMPCPHEFCAQDPPLTTAHIVWHCEAATMFWKELHARWTGGDTSDSALQTHIFARMDPRPTPQIPQLVTHEMQSVTAAHRLEAVDTALHGDGAEPVARQKPSSLPRPTKSDS